MAHQFSSPFNKSNFNQVTANIGQEDDFYDDDDEDDDSFNEGRGVDRIKRNYLHQSASNQQASSAGSQPGVHQQPEIINVKLDESYFAREKRFLINAMANVRNKLNSVQMFNPAKNQVLKEQQESWSENVSHSIICLPWQLSASNRISKIFTYSEAFFSSWQLKTSLASGDSNIGIVLFGVPILQQTRARHPPIAQSRS